MLEIVFCEEYLKEKYSQYKGTKAAAQVSEGDGLYEGD